MAKYYMVGIFFISIPNEINDETIVEMKNEI